MKTRKTEFIAALLVCAALLGATLMLSGCPEPISDPNGGGTDPGTGPGTNPGEPQLYDITISGNTSGGPISNGNIDTNPRRAAQGETITITLMPNPGYEPENLTVLEYGNFKVPFSPLAPITGGYTCTFTMPASLVRLSVDFSNLENALSNATGKISIYSSWEDIYNLNELIKKLQRQNPNLTPITTAINLLAGDSTKAEGTVERNGVILTKMWNEDLTKWMAFNYPSYPMDNNYDKNNKAHLYYVEEDNTTIPTLVPGKGWEAGTWFTPPPSPTTSTSKDNADAALYGIQEIPLNYTVGLVGDKNIKYGIWLYPVVQYTLVFEAGVTPTGKTVTLQDLKGTANFGDSQTLNQNYLQRTGNVGKVDTTDANKRQISVKITHSHADISLRIDNSAGNFVTGTVNNAPNSPLTSIITTGAPANATAEFYPASRRYTIRVMARTPPVNTNVDN